MHEYVPVNWILSVQAELDTQASGLPACNNDAVCVEQFPLQNSSSTAERVCHPGYGVTSLLHLRLLLTCLLRQAQLSDTARNFHSFFWHNVKFLSFIFKAGRFGSGKY